MDLLVVYFIARCRYGFRLTDRALRYFVMTIVLGSSVLGCALGSAGMPWLRYVGMAVVAVAAVLSLCQLSRHGNILTSVSKRIFKRFR